MTVQQALPPGKYRLRAEDHVLLVGTGAFGDEPTELIDGDVIVMSPEWRPHMRIKDELAYRLRRALEALGSDLFVGTGGSVLVSEHDQPRPDIILTRAIDGDGPVPVASIMLLVEISSSTLADDLGTKQRLYATAGVPEYWVADVNGRVIHLMWAPADGRYVQRREVPFGDRVTAATMPGLHVGTEGL